MTSKCSVAQVPLRNCREHKKSRDSMHACVLQTHSAGYGPCTNAHRYQSIGRTYCLQLQVSPKYYAFRMFRIDLLPPSLSGFKRNDFYFCNKFHSKTRNSAEISISGVSLHTASRSRLLNSSACPPTKPLISLQLVSK